MLKKLSLVSLLALTLGACQTTAQPTPILSDREKAICLLQQSVKLAHGSDARTIHDDEVDASKCKAYHNE